MEPYRVSLAAGVSSLKETGALSSEFWIRVMGITLLVAAGGVFALVQAYPGVAFPWTRIALTAVLGPPLLMALAALNILVPSFIEVHGSHIAVAQGQSGLRISAQSIRSLSLADEDGRFRLKVEYVTPRGKSRSRSFVVAEKVDRDKLATIVAELANRASAYAMEKDTPWPPQR